MHSEDAKALGLEYCSLEEVLKHSDIVSLHLPLLPETYHVIGKENIAKMKKGVVIINVSRGGLVDASAVIEGLKSGHIGGLAMDVYENEQSYFFSDCSDQVINDDVLANLLTYPNVIITAHQAFLTSEALEVSLPRPKPCVLAISTTLLLSPPPPALLSPSPSPSPSLTRSLSLSLARALSLSLSFCLFVCLCDWDCWNTHEADYDTCLDIVLVRPSRV